MHQELCHSALCAVILLSDRSSCAVWPPFDLHCSLERVGSISRQSLTGLQKLNQLTALTLLAAAEPFDPQQQLSAGMDAAAAAGLPWAGYHEQYLHGTGASSSSSSDSAWMVLLQLPHLRELVVGVVPRGQTLNLTTTLTQKLESPPPYGTCHMRMHSMAAAAAAADASLTAAAKTADPWMAAQQQQQQRQQAGLGSDVHRGRPGLMLHHHRHHQQQQQQGSSSQAGGWFLQGSAGQRYAQQEGAGVTAYVTPSQWSELADMQVGGSKVSSNWIM
jgi:hypothetical protein